MLPGGLTPEFQRRRPGVWGDVQGPAVQQRLLPPAGQPQALVQPEPELGLHRPVTNQEVPRVCDTATHPVNLQIAKQHFGW